MMFCSYCTDGVQEKNIRNQTNKLQHQHFEIASRFCLMLSQNETCSKLERDENDSVLSRFTQNSLHAVSLILGDTQLWLDEKGDSRGLTMITN